ncbi:MAG: ABC transporter ATP-binding protein [Verrucomicrobiales bacterium]
MIETDALCKEFGALRAVDSLSLTVPQGEFFAFLGPNAAGKTTTIKMLTGLIQPTSGAARICGHDIQRDPIAAKAALGFVPDVAVFYDKLTSVEFMRFMGEVFRMDPARIASYADELFDKFALREYAHEQIENLSLGTRQRLAIAAALLHEPKVIIIDEPMVGLDPLHAKVVKNELKARSRAGTTVFMSTHLLNIAEELADRIGIINHGRLIACGTMDELRQMRARDTGGKGELLEDLFLGMVEG